MKKYYAWGVYVSVGVFVSTSLTQAAVEAEPQVVERGPNHKVLLKYSDSGSPVGSYVELASGMHYWDGAQWAESREEIEIVDGGALAQRGPHKVAFAANANTLGAIDLVGADNTRLRSHVLGLAYTDLATGQSVLFAEIKDSIGELHRPNRVIYPDAFTDVKADLRYTYRRGSFEQDVILQQEPPSPAVYGLNPDTTRMEIFTEFLNPPVPGRTVASRSQPTAVARLGIQLPEVIDETLDFGEMKVGPGYAFSLSDGPADTRFPVTKTWEVRDNRQVLIEAIEYNVIKSAIDPLPQVAAPAKERMANRVGIPQRRGEFARVFPKAPPPKRDNKEQMLMAAASSPALGFVLDYTILTTTFGAFTFRGDTTYYLNSGCTFSGSITFEGGTIIKVTNTTATAF